jgi:hypothetical protein
MQMMIKEICLSIKCLVLKLVHFCEISDSNCSGYHGYVLMGYENIYYGKCVPLFARNLEPP